MTVPSKPDARHAAHSSDNAFDQPTGYSGQGNVKRRRVANIQAAIR